jgi:hypothetical protein
LLLAGALSLGFVLGFFLRAMISRAGAIATSPGSEVANYQQSPCNCGLLGIGSRFAWCDLLEAVIFARASLQRAPAVKRSVERRGCRDTATASSLV